jgi:hypothetical protein
MGFMIAYNLLSSSAANLRTYAKPSTTYRGNAGGLGRKGASRMIIFETDGAPNTRAVADLHNAGADSFYKVRIENPASPSSSSNVEWPSGGAYSSSEVYDVVKQVVAPENAAIPGYSTNRKPVLVHCIGYGTLFDPGNSSDGQKDALTFLQTVQYHGNTAETTSYADFPLSRRIYGTSEERIDRMRGAFTEIMQSGVQVSLIE